MYQLLTCWCVDFKLYIVVNIESVYIYICVCGDLLRLDKGIAVYCCVCAFHVTQSIGLHAVLLSIASASSAVFLAVLCGEFGVVSKVCRRPP